MAILERSKLLKAPPWLVWEVISDAHAFAQAAPNLSRVHYQGEPGLGGQRRCYNQQGRGWSETCTLWEVGQRYRMEVDTSDYPYPMRQMVGTFGLEATPEGTRLYKRFDYQMKYGLLGKWMLWLNRATFVRTCEQMLDNWEHIIAQRMAEPGAG